MIDVVTVGAGGGSIAWLSPEGTLKVGPKSAGADPGPMCYPNGGDQPTVTDAHVTLGRIPPHLLGGEIPLSVEAAIDGLAQLGAKLDLSLERTATGILEISAWNQANALRQVTVAKGLDVRDFTLTTFGGSGSLLACRLMDILNLPRTLVPPNPGNVSAFGLLTVDVRNDYVQTVVSKHARPRPGAACSRSSATWRPRRRPRWTARASAATSSACSGRRTCATSARPSRCASRWPTASSTAPRPRTSRRPSTPRTASSTATTSPTDPRQAVEWVNLRVSGIGPIRRPDMVELPAEGRRDGPGRHGLPPRLLRRLGRHPDLQPARPRARRRRHRARDHRGVRLDRPGAPRLRRHRRRLRQPAAHEGVGPVTERARRSTPTRSSSRSSPARWPRSRRRSRPPSGARRARR